MKAFIFDFVGVVGWGRLATSADPGDSPYVIELFDEVVEGIRRLRAAGKKTAMISNNDRTHFIATAPDVWRVIEPLFDVIVFSSDLGIEKPDTRIYQHTLAQLDVPAGDCHYFDDLARNVDAALTTGMPATVVTEPADVLAVVDDFLD